MTGDVVCLMRLQTLHSNSTVHQLELWHHRQLLSGQELLFLVLIYTCQFQFSGIQFLWMVHLLCSVEVDAYKKVDRGEGAYFWKSNNT